MLQKYLDFINESLISKEENYFILGNDLRSILKSISETSSDENVKKIASSYISLDNRLLNTSISLFILSEKNDMIKCLKSKDIVNIEDVDFSNDNLKDKYKNKLFDIKIGRLTNQIIELYNITVNNLARPEKVINVSNSDIEKFVNEFKAKYDYVYLEGASKISVVKGKDIRYYYLVDNYALSKGQLAYSCMRYEECQEFFSIYEDNDTVSLVIMLDNNGKLLGRALLFELDNGYRFMDRVYTSLDSDVLVFIEWARNNKILYKEKQNSVSSTKIMTPDNSYSLALPTKLVVKVSPLDIKYKKFYSFPYLDTLKYLYWDKGILSNTRDTDYGYYVFLEDGDGGALCNKCYNSGFVDCEECEAFEGCGKCDEGYIKCTNCGGFTYE